MTEAEPSLVTWFVIANIVRRAFDVFRPRTSRTIPYPLNPIPSCYNNGMKKTQKKIISFDLDGTIVGNDFGNMVWLDGVPRKYAERHGLSFEEALSTIKREYDSVGDAHLLWYDIDYWLERFDLAVCVPDLLDAYAPYIRLLPGAKEAITELRKRYQLVVASNAARIFVEKELGQSGLRDCFARVVSATSDYGMVKKEERFYTHLCEELQIGPDELAHVGDHRVFDCEVPLQVGIESYHYNPACQDNGRVINDLRELLVRL